MALLVLAGVALLAVVVAVLGPALTLVPLRGLRLVVGGLLLVFGLQWLRKAIMRYTGMKAIHDESKIYAREVAQLQSDPAAPAGGMDWTERRCRECHEQARVLRDFWPESLATTDAGGDEVPRVALVGA